MPSQGKKLQGRARSLANLKPGFKSSRLTYVDDGSIRRVAFLLGLAVEEMEDKLDASHQRRLSQITRYARELFESDTRRPDSSGDRPNARMTGKFTFGIRGGGTFVGVFIGKDKGPIQGFGYPNIPRADARTRYVWRTLEFGLGAYRQSSPHAPRGDFLMPYIFRFEGDRLIPVKGPAVGRPRMFIRDRSKKLRLVPAELRGIRPKTGRGFIRPAFERVKPFLKRDYQDAAKLIGRKFK